MNEDLRVSVVITTRNRVELVCECIDSVLESTYMPAEIIVVDDASTDGTRERIEETYGERVRVKRLSTHSMMVRTRNAGAKIAESELILFIDDDNLVHPQMIEELVDCMGRDRTHGIVGPRMYYEEDKDKPYMIAQRINMWTGRTTGITKANDPDAPELESDGVPNVFMVRRDVFEKAGFFDKGLVQSWTEPDFSFNARRHGFRTMICQRAATYHRIPASKDQMFGRAIIGGGFEHKAYFLTRNRFVFLKRYAHPLQLLFFTATFSWLFPLFYSIAALRYRHYSVIPLYAKGFVDGIYYVLSGRLRNSLEGI